MAAKLPFRANVPVNPGSGLDVERSMWHGSSKIVPAFGKMEPSSPRPPIPKTGLKIPGGNNRPELHLNLQTPFSYWSLPLDRSTICAAGVAWYDTWTTVQIYKVPDLYIASITNLGWEIATPVYDIFEVGLWRGGELLGILEDMKITAAPANPAYQYALGGPQRMLPFPVWVTGGQILQLRVRVRGPEVAGVFTKTNADPLGASVSSTLKGILWARLDTRDGGVQAGDLFDQQLKPYAGRLDTDEQRYVPMPDDADFQPPVGGHR